MAFMTREQLVRLNTKLKHEMGETIVEALAAPDVIEISVNSDGFIWLDILGEGLCDTEKTVSPENLGAALGTVAAMLGTELNEKSPLLEGRIPFTTSRISGSIPPVSPDGPSMSIRKHTSKRIPLTQYEKEERVTPDVAAYLRDALRDGKNIAVSGGTSSGKTTFTNALIAELVEIAPKDRLIVIEDTAELQCTTKNKQSFVTTETVTMGRLVKTAMRYRPDRILVGEVRGGEALELLKSWNTGHPGGITTLHANNAPAALLRMEQLVSEVSISPMSSLIGEAVDVVVHMEERGRIGRQVVEVIQVNGYRKEEYRYEHVYSLCQQDKSNNPKN